MIATPLRRALGNAWILALARGQRSIPFAPRHYIEKLRDDRVRRIVRYAALTVPFYRDAFRRLGLDPREIRTADDLARLPMIEKDDLRRDPEAFVSTSRAGRRSVPFESSGSTGSRVSIRHDARSLLANVAYGERERAVVTRILGRESGYREVLLGYVGGTRDKVYDFYRDWTWIPARPRRLELLVTAPFASNVEAINRFRPDVLFGYGSYLHATARAVAAGAISLERPKLLIYAAEPLSLATRHEIEAAMGAPLVARYTAVEAFKLAFLCEHRTGFHVHEDLAHIRILGADGRTARDGGSGCVVLSNLVNRGTVLLNYRMSDISRWSAASCACGRTLRMLDEIEGRAEDLLDLPNGEMMHPRAVWGVLKPHPEVLQYQLVQREPARFLLKLVTATRDDYARLAPRLARAMEALLGTGTSVETEACAELPREGGGKVRMVVALRSGSDPARSLRGV
ncbi:phenylacetate-CoA ligase [Burkholderiales bacterium]|nr:phenylacetate-CoA ligase [Burkholderiales bacterium]